MSFSLRFLAPLLAVSLVAACSPDDPASGGAGTGAPPPSGTAGAPNHQNTPPPELPAEVRGTWLDSWSTSMQYSLAANMYDFATGVWFGGLNDPWDMAPNRGFGLRFGADGSFLWVLGTDSGVGGCQSYTMQVIRGTVSAEGGTLKFHPTAQRQKYHSTCDPSLDFDRALDNEDFEIAYATGATQDTGLRTLRIVDQSAGIDTTYYLAAE